VHFFEIFSSNFFRLFFNFFRHFFWRFCHFTIRFSKLSSEPEKKHLKWIDFESF
jgi:hypothetical protein